ncbi:MAG TPA: hypothetical protein VFN71_07785 [Methylomirabilota bacterium]|nr:hypothetical protein [Methylomirabilota bacterium]
MSLLGTAILAFWADIEPAGEADYLHWHTKEHMPERVGIPGFLRGRRYVAVKGAPKYFMMYETESVATLAGPAYVERLNNPTPWTQRCLKLFRNSNRTACRTAASVGRGLGEAMATLRLGPTAGNDTRLREWLTRTAFPALLSRPDIVGVHLCEADLEATQVRTEEKKLRDRPDEAARWVVLVEGIEPEALDVACAELLDPEALRAHGAAADPVLGIYRLHYIL